MSIEKYDGVACLIGFEIGQLGIALLSHVVEASGYVRQNVFEDWVVSKMRRSWEVWTLNGTRCEC